MKKKIFFIVIPCLIILVGVITAVVIIVNNSNDNTTSSESSKKDKETAKTIKVGEHTLKLGEYQLTDDNGEFIDDEDAVLILEEGSYYYKTKKDKKYTYEIKGSTLQYQDVVIFWVFKDDKLATRDDGTSCFVYKGSSSNKTEEPVKEPTNKPQEEVKIKQTKQLKLVSYNGGEFTMSIPEGWKVSKGGTGLYYGIRVYDPTDERNQIFYILKEQPFYKKESAISSYKASMGYAPGIALGGSPTTEQIFKKNNEFANKAAELQKTKYAQEYKGFVFPVINNFKVIETTEGNSILHKQAVDDKVLRATFSNGTGEAEGLFNACVVDFGTLGYGMDQFSYYMAYNVSGITTAIDELVNYEDILLASLNSIKFSTSYAKTTVDQINATTNNALNVSNQLNQAYKSYNDAWSNRQKSYDIMSQKRSDATLGYERVYDTETGEIYKAYNGFTDDYKGSRYKAISDSQYTDKIAGYIEK